MFVLGDFTRGICLVNIPTMKHLKVTFRTRCTAALNVSEWCLKGESLRTSSTVRSCVCSIGSDPLLGNKDRYPATLAFGPADHGSLVSAVKSFVDRQQWRTLMVLCDTLTGQSAGAFYLMECINTRRMFPVNNGQYDVKNLDVDSHQSGILDFKYVLDQIGKQSRGEQCNSNDCHLCWPLCSSLLQLFIIACVCKGYAMT